MADNEPRGRGESARDLASQSLYHLVRLARLGLQAAASGVERMEQSMAKRQQERGEARPLGEAPPTSRPSSSAASPASPVGEGTGEPLGRTENEGASKPHEPNQSRH